MPGVYEINICSQCGVCANECPVGAINVKDAAYVIDDALCIDCGVCVQSCPTNSMVRHASITTPIKCVSCGACVEYCPRRALVWRES
jgi:NAD-dependent dihydropyrimidine dehydrogenase PreA subunit